MLCGHACLNYQKMCFNKTLSIKETPKGVTLKYSHWRPKYSHWNSLENPKISGSKIYNIYIYQLD